MLRAETRSLFGRLDKPVAVVLFAGFGGACRGIRDALGVDVHAAVNHDPHAIALHRENHPTTLHFQEDVWKVVPKRAARGRKVNIIWMSADCRHHSKAKGGKPREHGIRSLADVIFRWIDDCSPNFIFGENVEEFADYGPLDDEGHPIKALKGTLFRAWVAGIRARGYAFEYRILSACDYGAPTSRRRLYFVARRDGKPIVWPEPTHGPGRLKPWRTAAECIDWSIPALSIFADREEAKAWAKRTGADGVPKRPLAEATERRIAEGIRRFVLENPRPFLVNLTHGGTLEDLGEPVRTVTAAHRGEKAILCPILSKAHSHGWDREGGPAWSPDAPLRTTTAKDATVLAAATLVQTGYGERPGQTPRALDIEQPLGTVVGCGQKHGLVEAELTAAGTTALCAARLGHSAVICEVNPGSVRIAKARLEQDAPMFNRVEVRV